MSVYIESVYPPGGKKDNYKKAKTALYHPDVANRMVSSVWTISEGGGAQVTIYDGYLGLDRVDLCFAGNNPDFDAYVIYGYDGH